MEQYKLSNILRKVLEKVGIAESYYSVGKYRKWAICIEKVDKDYIVYYAEKEQRYDCRRYKKEVDACIEIIRRFAIGKEEFETLKKEFCEAKAKEILKEVLQKEGIPQYKYSLDGYAEDVVCMEKGSTGYFVYVVKEDEENELIKHPNIAKAFIDVISRLIRNDIKEQKVIYDFITELKKV